MNKSPAWLDAIFCSLALLAWGVGSGRAGLSAIMGVAVLALTLSPWRAASGDKAKSRSNDATLLILFASAIWLYVQRQTFQDNWAFHLLSLCPAIFFPKLAFNAIQLGGSSNSAPPRRDGAAIARSWMQNEWSFSRRSLDAPTPLRFEAIYFFVAIFIACLTLPWKAGMPICVGLTSVYCVATSGVLTAKLKSWPIGLLALCLCIGASFIGGRGIEAAQDYAEEYLSKLWTSRADPRQNASTTDTSIGRKGRISNGNKLIARIEWQQSRGYIRDGIYSYTNNGSTWYSASPGNQHKSRSIYPADGGTFPLARNLAALNSVASKQAKMSMNFPKDKTALPLPSGAYELFGLPMSRLDLNEMGVPVATGSPGFTKFGIAYAPEGDEQPGPGPDDLSVPSVYERDLDEFIEASGAAGLAPAQAAAAISDYFRSNWTYTLNLESEDGTPRTLSKFLRRDRHGHCEYFASATTLALRRLGIPARYETGFQVSEFNEDEKLYWIRARDAHAWSTYWNGASWIVADSTPGGAPEELGLADHGMDLLARFQYFLDGIDAAAITQSAPNWLAWLLAVIIFAYLIQKARFSKGAADDSDQSQETLRLCAKLENKTGLLRQNNETSSDFLRRCAPLTRQPELLFGLADQRDDALFTQGEKKRLAETEIEAKNLLRRIALAKRQGKTTT